MILQVVQEIGMAWLYGIPTHPVVKLETVRGFVERLSLTAKGRVESRPLFRAVWTTRQNQPKAAKVRRMRRNERSRAGPRTDEPILHQLINRPLNGYAAAPKPMF